MALIMIVDDDLFIHKVLNRILVKGNHQVLLNAYDGADAIKKYTVSDQKPDVILMDHRMPVMDGVTSTRELLKINPDVKILFISADSSVHDQALESGSLCFLVKPLTISTLFEHIEKFHNP